MQTVDVSSICAVVEEKANESGVVNTTNARGERFALDKSKILDAEHKMAVSFLKHTYRRGSLKSMQRLNSIIMTASEMFKDSNGRRIVWPKSPSHDANSSPEGQFTDLPSADTGLSTKTLAGYSITSTTSKPVTVVKRPAREEESKPIKRLRSKPTIQYTAASRPPR